MATSEIVEIEEDTVFPSFSDIAEQNEEDPVTTVSAIASSIKNLVSAVDINESKKTLKKAVNSILAAGRMTESKADHEQADTDSTSNRASGNPFKRLATFFMKDDGESSDTELIDPVELGVPELFRNSVFESSEEFRHWQACVDDLVLELKFCLYCFSVFPENAVIKRRVMIYWWIGESLIPPFLTTGSNEEEVATKFFDELVAKGFLVRVSEKWSSNADGYRIQDRFVRLVIITLAERAEFFKFDEQGNPTTTFSGSHRACLVGKGFPNHQTSKLGRLETLFNCSEYYLNFKPDLLLRMRSAKVLYLGVWQALAEHHIEVDDEEFLKGLKYMKFLRLFSLQGVSGITMLPDSVFYDLQNLLILDVRACHSLEYIPSNIGFLKSLTHLDISGCYLLEYVPKTLCLLSKLQVLKGFIVLEDPLQNEYCTLEDLARCEHLRKLSIFTRSKEFPKKTHLIAFNMFRKLGKLTIEWEEDNDHNITPKFHLSRNPRALDSQKALISSLVNDQQYYQAPTLPVSLTKLDLLCLPRTTLPKWLNPDHLPALNKLYIRGALISEMGHKMRAENKWRSVQVLRLKHMPNLDMNWRQFQQVFPHVVFLEIIQCPKLTFFPCNAKGIWVNKKTSRRSRVQ